MNPEQIYHAQLNALKNISAQSITDLINKLNTLGEASYNYSSRCIEVENKDQINNSDIKNILTIWLNELEEINSEDKSVLINNVDFLFNIIKIGCPDIENNITQIYLY